MQQRLLQQQFALLASLAQLMIKVTLLISLLAIAACEKTPHLKAEAIAGYLHTPWGKFKFKNVSKKTADKMKLLYYNGNYRLYLVADAGNVIVAWGGGKKLLIYSPIDHLQYGNSAPLTIKSNNTKISNEDGETSFKYLAKDVNKKLRNRRSINFVNDMGTKFTRFAFGPNESFNDEFGKDYKTYIPFNLGGDDFLVDITVKNKTVYTYDIDIAPAIPH